MEEEEDPVEASLLVAEAPATAAAAGVAREAGRAPLVEPPSVASGTPATPPSPPAPPSLFQRIYTACIIVVGLICVGLHFYGRRLNHQVADAASGALKKILAANFTYPMAGRAVPKEEDMPAAPPSPNGFHAASHNDFEAWSSGRRNVLGCLTSLTTQSRAIPSYWLQQYTGGPRAAHDVLTLELPVPTAPRGLISVLADFTGELTRKDFLAIVPRLLEKQGAARVLEVKVPTPQLAPRFTVLAEHKDIFSSLVKAVPGLEAALTPGKDSALADSLLALHVTDAATLAGLHTAKLSERCLVVQVKCPSSGRDIDWDYTVGAWLTLALSIADALPQCSYSKTATSTVERGRKELEVRRESKLREERLAKERHEKLAKMTPGSSTPP